MFYVIVCIFYLFLSHCVLFFCHMGLVPEINVMSMMIKWIITLHDTW